MLSSPPSDQKLNTLSDPGNYDKYFQTINKPHLHASLQEQFTTKFLGRSTNTKDVLLASDSFTSTGFYT